MLLGGHGAMFGCNIAWPGFFLQRNFVVQDFNKGSDISYNSFPSVLILVCIDDFMTTEHANIVNIMPFCVMGTKQRVCTGLYRAVPQEDLCRSGLPDPCERLQPQHARRRDRERHGRYLPQAPTGRSICAVCRPLCYTTGDPMDNKPNGTCVFWAE